MCPKANASDCSLQNSFQPPADQDRPRQVKDVGTQGRKSLSTRVKHDTLEVVLALKDPLKPAASDG